jgi:hypothetical protein
MIRFLTLKTLLLCRLFFSELIISGHGLLFRYTRTSLPVYRGVRAVGADVKDILAFVGGDIVCGFITFTIGFLHCLLYGQVFFLMSSLLSMFTLLLLV